MCNNIHSHRIRAKFEAMLEAVKTHALQWRHLYFTLICVASIISVVQWQFELMGYFSSNRFRAALVNETFHVTLPNVGVNGRMVTQSLRSSHNGLSCENLIRGELEEVKKAKNYMTRNFRRSYLPEVYPPMTKNCSRYLSSRDYINFTVNKEEKTFPLAFSVLVFKDPEQVERLLQAIWRPHNLYCIHIDKKSPNIFKEAIKLIAKCFDNVFVHPLSVDVRWGTFTVLEPELICMDLLWKRGTKWKYFINLTGQEFPLKTNYELYLILKSYNGSNDIIGGYERANLDRWRGRGNPPHRIQPRKGSVHIAASRAFVDYVLHNKTAKDLLKWVKNTGVPDETYFATLNYNPHLKIPGTYTGLVDDGHGLMWNRYKIWYDRRRCAGKCVHSICVFSVGDLQNLTESKFLFANKCHYDYDYLTYDCLEEWYHRKVDRERKGYWDFDTTPYRKRWIVTHHF